MEQGTALIAGIAGRHAAVPGPAHITSCHTGSERDREQQVQQKNGAASRGEAAGSGGNKKRMSKQAFSQTTIRKNRAWPAQSHEGTPPADCPERTGSATLCPACAASQPAAQHAQQDHSMHSAALRQLTSMALAKPPLSCSHRPSLVD